MTCRPRHLRRLTTRAQRALVRRLHNVERQTVLEIADYLNMGPTVVERVVVNESDDDVESDANYISDLTLCGDSNGGLEGLELMYPDEKASMDTNATSSGNPHYEDDHMDDTEVEQRTSNCSSSAMSKVYVLQSCIWKSNVVARTDTKMVRVCFHLRWKKPTKSHSTL